MVKAYLERDGEKELLLEDVTRLEREGNMLRLSTLFGKTKEIEAVVVGIDFEAGNVLLEGLEHS
jgi:predicted RNA-binding protein